MQLLPDLAHPVDLAVLPPQTPNLRAQPHVALCPRRLAIGIARARRARIGERRGNRQDPDRLDPVRVAVRIITCYRSRPAPGLPTQRASCRLTVGMCPP